MQGGGSRGNQGFPRVKDAMGQLKSNGIGTVGPSLVVTKEDLEFIKLEQKQQERQP